MKDLLNINKKYFTNQKIKFYNKNKIKIIDKNLEKEKLITITSLRNINKTAYIKNIIDEKNLEKKTFYFNKNLDFLNKIESDKDLVFLIKEYTLTNNKAEIIILEEVDKIKNIKNFIKNFYIAGYKIIIIGNNIKISSKPEIEIFNPKYKTYKKYLDDNFNISKNILFGDNENIINLENKTSKLNLLNSNKNEILLKDIIEKYSIKNTFLFNHTITFLSLHTDFLSLRELHRNISKQIKISLITLIEYIDFALESKIIKKIYPYDFKKEKQITTKAKYYFSDLGIRNSFNYFSSSKKILIENLIFLELEKKGYKINSGINGKFDFSFYGIKQKLKKDKNTLKINKIFVHISNETKKENIKKEIKKLNKVPYFPSLSKSGENIDETIYKYIIVDSIKNTGMKKLKYDGVEILELENFLKI